MRGSRSAPGGRKRTRTPHALVGRAHCFRNRSGPLPVFLPLSPHWNSELEAPSVRSRWSVLESNQLRIVFQTIALPFELTDLESCDTQSRRSVDRCGRSGRQRTCTSPGACCRATRVPGGLHASWTCLPRLLPGPWSRIDGPVASPEEVSGYGEGRAPVLDMSSVPWSGRQDLHLRSPVPQTGAFAWLSYALNRDARARGAGVGDAQTRGIESRRGASAKDTRG